MLTLSWPAGSRVRGRQPTLCWGELWTHPPCMANSSAHNHMMDFNTHRLHSSKSTRRIVNSLKVKSSCRWLESHTCHCHICWRPPATTFQQCKQHVLLKHATWKPQRFASIVGECELSHRWVDFLWRWVDHEPASGLITGFVQTLESPGIKMLRFPGLENPGKKA